MARSATLQRPSARRCRAIRPPARSERRGSDQDREEQIHCNGRRACASILAETLAAGPCGDLTFIVGERGQPLTKESFGNAFREACCAAGVPGSAHGVRKIAATTAANNGATTSQLKALFAWTSDAMPTLYTR